jgi:hypothetical protein
MRCREVIAAFQALKASWTSPAHSDDRFESSLVNVVRRDNENGEENKGKMVFHDTPQGILDK